MHCSALAHSLADPLTPPGPHACRLVASQEPGLDFYSIAQGKITERISTNDVGLRTFALSADDSHLALVDLNGTVTIYRLHGTAALLAAGPFSSKDMVSQHISLLDKALLRDRAHGCRLCWLERADGPVLVVPTDKCLTCLTPHADKWTETFIFPDSTQAAQYTVAAACNGFLAAASAQGALTIWKIDQNLSASQVVRTIETSALYDLAWGDNCLMLVTDSSWARVEDVVPAAWATAAPAPVATLMDEDEYDDDFLAAVQAAEAAALASQAMQPQSPAPAPAVPFSQAMSPAIEKKPFKRLHPTHVREKDVEDALFDDEPVKKPAVGVTAASSSSASAPAASAAAGKSKTKSLFQDEAEDDGDVDDEDGSVLLEEDEQEPMSVEEVLKLAAAVKDRAAPIKLQEPFQPSSTKADEKSRRYLVWNHVGTITMKEESMENRIEIRFSNMTIGNKNEAFPDRSGFVMAALSFEGAVFATEVEKVDEEAHRLDAVVPKGKGATIYYHAFSGKHLQGANESFHWALPPNEGVLALAAGKGWIAAVTSRHMLRIFSSAGSEVSVTWLPGPVVCMAGYEGKLAVVYHAAAPLQETACMAMKLFQIDWSNGCRGQCIAECPVPLSPKSQLEWVGYDADHQLVCIMDSCGVLSGLTHAMGWQWTPLLEVQEVRKTIDQKYWPVNVRHDKLVYVLLNGESKPALHPQPVVSLKALKVSVLAQKDGKEVSDLSKEKAHKMIWEDHKAVHLEHEVSAAQASASQDLQQLEAALDEQAMESDKNVLKMLQDACQTQQIALALALAMRLRTTKVMEAAITVANHFGRAQVAQALDQMLQYKLYVQQMAASYGNGQQPLEEQQSQSQMGEQGIAYEDSPEEVQEVAQGVLSKKASMKASYPPLHRAAAAVSPDAAAEGAQEKVNPFAVHKTGNTPLKRKSIQDEVQDLKATPSPKKPALSVSPLTPYDPCC